MNLTPRGPRGPYQPRNLKPSEAEILRAVRGGLDNPAMQRRWGRKSSTITNWLKGCWNTWQCMLLLRRKKNHDRIKRKPDRAAPRPWLKTRCWEGTAERYESYEPVPEYSYGQHSQPKHDKMARVEHNKMERQLKRMAAW